MKKLVLIGALLSSTLCIWAQSHISTQSHQDQVNKLIPAVTTGYEGSYFSAGEDGFVVKWSDDDQGEHYQFSDVGIKLIALSPNGNDIAIYETDGGSVNKVSVWDWRTFNRKYQKKFSDSVTSLSFSAKGTYLIIGTATVDGAVFVKTNTWTVVDKIKTNTSIVNYINTSSSEKTCVFYSPAGSLTYYNLADGKVKAKFSITPGLTQTIMYNENKNLAGIKDNQIYVINAYKGNTLASIPANNPIILSTEKDFNLYYLEYDGRNSYELKMLENLDNGSISNPRIVKTMKGPRGNAAITTGIKDSATIFLGARNGAIFKIDSDPSITTYTLSELTENTYSKINGMVPSESDFYFLTSNAIYKSSYDTGIVDKLAVTDGQTQITKFKDNNVILWSKGTRNPVIKMDLDKKSSEPLFTPKSNLQSLNVFTYKDEDYIVEIESNSIVNIYNINSKEFKEMYSGSGVQDAVLCRNGNLYIAKSAATNPQVPLLSVNLTTMETVPISVKGNVTYALSTDGEVLYGINLISDETGRNTYVFSFNTTTKQMTNILKFADEDAEAFTYLNGNNLFTNIGKNKVYCYNLQTKKRFAYNRSASIPLSICQNNKRVVILNTNGSISWCGTVDSRLLADWYFTNDEQWYEF